MRAVFQILLLILPFIFGLTACGNSNGDGMGVPSSTYITEPNFVILAQIPTGAEIVYHKDMFIYVMDLAGEIDGQITFENPRVWEHAAVSYDGRYIVANEQLPNPQGIAGGFSRLWLFDLEESTEARLVPDFVTAGNGGVDWDSEGFIYFAGKAEDIVTDPMTPEDFMKNAGANDIYKIKYDGTELTRLADTPTIGEADVGVSDDGTMLAYVAIKVDELDNQVDIWVMSTDGTNPHMIIEGGPNGVTSVHDPEFSDDNKRVFFSRVNPDVPPNFPNIPAANTAHDIYGCKLDGTDCLRLTKPGPISIVPNVKGNLVAYLEINEAGMYAGGSIVTTDGEDQLPIRIKENANMPKWIP